MSSETLEGFRISPRQSELWRFASSEAATFKVRGWIRVEGRLDVAVCRQAVAAVVEQHEVFRTSFRRAPGMSLPVQVIEAESPLDWRFHDLGEPSREALSKPSDRSLRPLIEQLVECRGEATHPMSATLVRLAEDEHQLILDLSPLCGDEQGLRILVEAVATSYGVRVSSASPFSPSPEILQYADFSEVCHDLLAAEEAQEGRRFWRELALDDGLDLELGSRWGAQPDGFRPRSLVDRRPEAWALEAQRWAEQRGASLEDFLLAGWQVLLSRSSGRRRIVVGRRSSGRTFEGLDQAIGPFARYVPVVAELGHHQPFSEVLTAIREHITSSADWEDFFSWEALDGELAQRSFFPCCFDFQPHWDPREAGGCRFALHRLEVIGEPFELCLRGQRRADGLDLSLEYDAGLYSSAAAGQLLSALVALLDSAMAGGEMAIAELSLASDSDQHRSTVEWNDTARTPIGELLPHAVWAWARRDSGRVAVEHPAGDWTYGELWDRSQRVEGALAARGVAPEEVVGVLMEGSPQILTLFLGILSAGAAFLPLDPDLPSERLAHMVEEAGARWVITRAPFRHKVPESASILLDEDLLASDSSVHPPGSGLHPERLAYVLFTSGSSGRPKGVMISHGSLANYLIWARERLWGQEVERLPVLTNPSFDASLKQLFGPLIAGQRVWFLPPETLESPAAMVATLGRYPGVGINCVPGFWRVVMDALEVSGEASADPPRRIFLGGERLGEDLLRRTRDRLPRTAIWNLYGPTEATANAMAGDLDTACVTSRGMTLGAPVRNTRIYNLNRRLRPVPEGQAGQIYIAGTGLARGYCRRPDLSAERFIPDGIGHEPGQRMYATGDLARFLPGGHLEFLGRLDHQVKLRGYRIELEEISATMQRHPDIEECAAVARSSPNGEKLLCLYVQPVAGRSPSIDALRSFLAEHLPRYMLPDHFHLMESMPHTAGGKIDRQALPDIDLGKLSSSRYVAPETPFEERLADLWAEALALDRVGRTDHFYEIGGTSLLALRLQSRIQKELDAFIPIKLFFSPGSLSAIAAAVESASVQRHA